ncbi:hypothetical protein JNW91_17195 [Micromonospora sp. STR1_7]|uniref:Uncharacterized protein n=1 Tax=Micromonospora parastrephiae TaxID=2806101 RepID=A0ABS1XVZ3_9ACTN|nr:hypothetical protein [Micromonospora parastrephiae]MBM0233438.1 hypothetical protein [Micromonospora parastrephiae]
MAVTHQPRVAWDTARAIVDATRDEELFGWLSVQLGDLLGPAYQDSLDATRDQLRHDPDGVRASAEAGLWRTRVEDLLRARPELAGELRGLTTLAAGLLRERSGHRPSTLS